MTTKDSYPERLARQRQRNRLRGHRPAEGWARAEEVRDLYFRDELTQREIAERLGISQTAVSNILRRRSFPPEARPLDDEGNREEKDNAIE